MRMRMKKSGPILLKIVLLLSSSLIDLSCLADRIGGDINQDVTFTLRLNYEWTNTVGYKATRDIHLEQDNFGQPSSGYKYDCCSTVMRMWLMYIRNIAYRNGWFITGMEDSQYLLATSQLSESSVLGILDEYNNNTGYNYLTSPYPNNSMDWVKWTVRNNSIISQPFPYGTFIRDPAMSIESKENLFYTWLFIMHLFEDMFFKVFDIGEAYTNWLINLWDDHYLEYYPAAPLTQYSGFGGIEPGMDPFQDVIAMDDENDFWEELLEWADYYNNLAVYEDGHDYKFDKASLLIIQNGDDLSTLHVVLLTGMIVHFDAGDPRDPEHAEVSLIYQDPFEPLSYPLLIPKNDPSLRELVNLDDASGNKLLYKRYICIFLGSESLGKARYPGWASDVDVDAKIEYYREKKQRRIGRLLVPILQYLLEEE